MENRNLSINLNSLFEIEKIINEDSTNSTYKFALLKATIDTISKYEHYCKKIENGYISIPLFFITESFFFDYIPFEFKKISQQKSRKDVILNKELDFLYNNLLKDYASWEEAYNKLKQMYDYEYFDKNEELFLKLFKSLLNTILKMPIKYIGGKNNNIFIPIQESIQLRKISKFDKFDLIKYMGLVKIKKEYFDVFKYLGDNLIGYKTIFSRWKTTILQNNNEIDKIFYKTFDRNQNSVRNILKDKSNIRCIWSKKVLKNSYDIDHILPYSVYYNNDLWNLMPTDSKINNKKRDKIPSPKLIESSKEIIEEYWQFYISKKSKIFNKQIELFFGNSNNYIEVLKNRSNYLIKYKGYPSFDI